VLKPDIHKVLVRRERSKFLKNPAEMKRAHMLLPSHSFHPTTAYYQLTPNEWVVAGEEQSFTTGLAGLYQ